MEHEWILGEMMSKRKKYMTMGDKRDFLTNMQEILFRCCEKITYDLSPSQSNVHPSVLYLEGREGRTEDALNKARESLRKAAQAVCEKGPDGNHHKLGRYVRKVGNHTYDAADFLLKGNPQYIAKLSRIPFSSQYVNRLDIGRVKEKVEAMIFSKDIRKLTP